MMTGTYPSSLGWYSCNCSGERTWPVTAGLVGAAAAVVAAVVAATVGAEVAAGMVGSAVVSVWAGWVGSVIRVAATVGWTGSMETGGAMPSGERVPWAQEICPPLESPEPNPQAARMGRRNRATTPKGSQCARCGFGLVDRTGGAACSNDFNEPGPSAGRPGAVCPKNAMHPSAPPERRDCHRVQDRQQGVSAPDRADPMSWRSCF